MSHYLRKPRRSDFPFPLHCQQVLGPWHRFLFDPRLLSAVRLDCFALLKLQSLLERADQRSSSQAEPSCGPQRARPSALHSSRLSPARATLDLLPHLPGG